MANAAADTVYPFICECADSELARLLRDLSDFPTQVEMEISTAHDKWCSLMTDYTSVDRLQRAFGEPKVEAQTFFDLNSQFSEDRVDYQWQVSA